MKDAEFDQQQILKQTQEDVSPELVLEAMRMYRDFVFSDDARAAVESWARANRKETWTELDGLATRTLGM